MSRNRVTITVLDGGKRICIRGWRAVDLAREAGLKPVHNAVSGWTLDYKRLETLLVYLDHRHVLAVIEDPRQASLFGPGGPA